MKRRHIHVHLHDCPMPGRDADPLHMRAAAGAVTRASNFVERHTDSAPHDPKNGQFTSGQHSEQASYHREQQAHHEAEAKKHGEASTSPYGSHGNAASHHYSAAFHHENAAKNPAGAEQAHKASKLAGQASKKVASQGANYTTPSSKPREEKVPLTSQQHSAKRISRYLAEHRIRMR